jgi:hypothetical protein
VELYLYSPIYHHGVSLNNRDNFNPIRLRHPMSNNRTSKPSASATLYTITNCWMYTTRSVYEIRPASESRSCPALRRPPWCSDASAGCRHATVYLVLEMGHWITKCHVRLQEPFRRPRPSNAKANFIKPALIWYSFYLSEEQLTAQDPQTCSITCWIPHYSLLVNTSLHGIAYNKGFNSLPGKGLASRLSL